MITKTPDKRIFHGVDVKRFQYEEYATNLSEKKINLQNSIGKYLFDKEVDMNCVLINLEKDHNRYNNSIQELKKVGISNFSHLKATYWKDRDRFCKDLSFVLEFLKDFNPLITSHKIEVDDFSFINDDGIHIQDGPLACYISHLRSMILGYTLFNDYTIICEDDIYIANTELIEKYLPQVPQDWDVVMFNACSKNKIYDDVFYKFDEDFHSCHFYIIRNKALPTIFKGMYPIIDQVDVLLSNMRNQLNIYNIQETVYQRNISTNTQNNLWVIFNSPHYDGIRENIKGIETGLFNLCNLILPENYERNKIIVQDLMYDILWEYITKTPGAGTETHPNKETFSIDLELYSDYPDFHKILDNLRFVLQCTRKGIKGDSEALSILSIFIHTLQSFTLHSDSCKALGFGSTSHTYLSNNSVIKKYNEKLRWVTNGHDDSKLIFQKEVEILKKLQEYSLSPKLIDYNFQEMTITTEFCGVSLWDEFRLPKDWKEQIQKILNRFDEVGIFYPEFRLQNILVKDDLLTFVDYGLASFDGEKNHVNYSRFINHIDKIEKKVSTIADRNTRLYLITTYLMNSGD